MIATAAHCKDVLLSPTATSTVNSEIRMVIAMAPYNRTERRPTRSTVKMRGTQPSAKNMLRTPDRSETRDGLATVERMMLPNRCQCAAHSYHAYVTCCSMRSDSTPSTPGSSATKNTCKDGG